MTTTENAVLLGYHLKMLFSGRNSPFVEEDKNLLGESTGGIFPGGYNEQIFGWWEDWENPMYPSVLMHL